MSCFGCCEENDIHKAADTGPYMANNSAGDSVFLNHGYFLLLLVGPSYSFTLKLVEVFFIFFFKKIGWKMYKHGSLLSEFVVIFLNFCLEIS